MLRIDIYCPLSLESSRRKVCLRLWGGVCTQTTINETESSSFLELNCVRNHCSAGMWWWNFHHYESSAKIIQFYSEVTDDSNNNIWFKGAKWYEADHGTFLRILIWIILSIQQQRQRSVGWSLIINHWMWKYVITAPRLGLHFANVWLHLVLMYNLLITSLLIQTS